MEEKEGVRPAEPCAMARRGSGVGQGQAGGEPIAASDISTLLRTAADGSHFPNQLRAVRVETRRQERKQSIH